MDEPVRPILILSDTHLGREGHGAGSAEALRPLWRDAAHVIINGDVAELHDPGQRVAAARQVERLEALCQADGVELTLLSGNHDPLLTDRRSLTLCGGAVFLTHGDALHPCISPWTDHRAELRRRHERAIGRLAEDERDDRDARLAAAQYASHFQWIGSEPDDVQDDVVKLDDRRDHTVTHAVCPSKSARLAGHAIKVARVLWYWHRLPATAARYATRYAPSCRFFIFGHIHRAGIWRLDGRVVINTGSYHRPRNPRAVRIDENGLAVYRVRRSGHHAFALSPRPLARFELEAAAA